METTPSDTQGLLRALHSGIDLIGAQGTIGVDRDQILVCCMPGNQPTPVLSFLSLLFLLRTGGGFIVTRSHPTL